MTFEELNLNKPLINALNDLGYTTPTTIQQNVFSVVMSGRDVCGLAQTGTGKTLAYLLPCLRQLQFSKDKLPQLLIIVPTRELVVQVLETVNQVTTYMNLTAVGVYGGVNLKPQAAQVQQGMDILIATPGRLVDLLSSGVLKTKAIKKLVIDEVDEMLDLGFRTQLKIILDLLPPKRQNLLFSATLTTEVEKLIETFFNNPVRVEAAPVGTPLENIAQTAYDVPNFYTKINLLKLLLSQDETMNKVLVFVATKQLADQVYEEMDAKFPDQLGIIHSNKAQNQRFEAVEKFKSGVFHIVIATDIIARGLDVAEVSHVVNFDMPDVPENYIHRIGRTGRADQKGIAITFITPADQEKQEAIEALMNYQIPLVPLPDDLAISEVLTDDEKPKVYMKMPEVKVPKREDVGPAFHEKLAKNKKVNVRRDHAAEKMLKYGRPIKRSGKK
ncbi:DEAD/DEAH box helicase [Spirosoma sp. HMF4905]|uniref:DEAD/DEAH box helicase n=1 Tax=Spirosoma arboris TaxID=2682092 RepID=A0A7K1SE80_9BACT|nr:DEAD/DEAH box helicase [Spirosoma arboris]MVM32103.1 DEAD/DEAH box helicase [Spirosoma arboris]